MTSGNNQPEDQATSGVAVFAPSAACGEPFPIWLAALMAAACHATANGKQRPVCWNPAHGRALYTNVGRDAEMIHPFGVRLEGGHTIAVHWVPGETQYTIEVYPCTALALGTAVRPAGEVLQ